MMLMLNPGCPTAMAGWRAEAWLPRAMPVECAEGIAVCSVRLTARCATAPAEPAGVASVRAASCSRSPASGLRGACACARHTSPSLPLEQGGEGEGKEDARRASFHCLGKLRASARRGEERRVRHGGTRHERVEGMNWETKSVRAPPEPEPGAEAAPPTPRK